jgi:hypothetical protein
MVSDPRYPAPPAPLADLAPPKKRGWGLVGCLFIVISLAVGVGLGLTAFRYLPVP